MLKSTLYDYSDAYILVSGTITITGAGDHDNTRGADERNKGVIFKYCAPFTHLHLSELYNTQIDNAKVFKNIRKFVGIL